jgi:orotate phosphoribosyltransferase
VSPERKIHATRRNHPRVSRRSTRDKACQQGVRVVKLEDVRPPAGRQPPQSPGRQGRQIPLEAKPVYLEAGLARTGLEGAARLTGQRHGVSAACLAKRRQQDLVLAAAPRAGAVHVEDPHPRSIRVGGIRAAVAARWDKVPAMTSNEPWLTIFRERGALLEGHFLLSSGLHSPRYLQCALLLSDPDLATRLGSELAQRLRPLLAGSEVRAVVAPALGGVLVAHEVARGLGTRGLFTERQDGVMTLRRGFRLGPGEPVIVVEDVITTGGSTREVMDAVTRAGARTLAVGSLVDRSGGRVELGVPRASLLTLEVATFDAGACPLCRSGTRAEKPGSRT